jgi:hypothetical protein
MTSLYSGGVVSGLGTATFSVTAGLGYIVSQTLVQVEPTYVAVSFSAVTAVTPLYTRGIIYVNSAGAILQADVSLTPVTQLFKKQNIILAAYVVFGGIIASIPTLKSTAIGTPSKLEDLMEALGPLNLRGNIYSANGANLLLNKSAGQTFQLKSNIVNSLEVRDITTDAAASPIANATTAYGYRNGSGGFTLIPYTGVTPNVWDNGSGTPAAVTNGHFTIQRIYYFNESNSTIIYLGQTQYNTLALADAAVGTEIRVIDDAIAAATLRCSLVIKRNTTDLTNTNNVAFFEASKFNASGAGSSSGTTTLQGAYNNSITPEITTNSTLGGLSVQRGSAADTDNIIEGKNGAGTTTFAVDGNGKTTTASLVIGSISGVLKSTSGTVSAAIAGTDYQSPIGFTPANDTLSNLGSTAVNNSITPDSNIAHTLGASGLNWLSLATKSILYDDIPNYDVELRKFIDSGSKNSLDYENRFLLDKSGTLVLDWDTCNIDKTRFGLTGISFETVSKNLKQYNYALNYTSGALTSIVYTIPTVGTITKTLNYTSGVLTSVVLSGSTPLGISLTKTLTYTSGVLTAVAYS